jgi:Ala-tRNA(Pro) deacylase
VAVSKSIANLLAQQGIDYSLVSHPHSESSDVRAQAAHVSGEHLAKGVLLKDNRGYLLAVIPATHVLETGTLSQKVRRPLVMASEQEIARLFADCEIGAVPVLGSAYNLTNVVDHVLSDASEIFFEAGDHETLVRVDSKNFKCLMNDATYARFSHHKG